MLYFWFGCALEGESEDDYQVSEGEENETEQNLSECEKEGSKGGADLLAFAFGHGVRG